jgi:A nuclease family of the HNH/ENDO VII superfamily with conserved AHH
MHVRQRRAAGRTPARAGQRRHLLMREAHKRGLFKPDAPENIALLAERKANGMVPDKVPGLSEGLPRHQGAHREYSEAVTRAANIVTRTLEQKFGTLDNVPDEVIREAAAEVLARYAPEEGRMVRMAVTRDS